MDIGDTTVFADATLRCFLRNDGEVRYKIDYGPSLGSQIVATLPEALALMDEWSVAQIGRVSKQLAGLAKMRRFIAKHADVGFNTAQWDANCDDCGSSAAYSDRGTTCRACGRGVIG